MLKSCSGKINKTRYDDLGKPCWKNRWAQRKKNGSTSLENDNMCYVSFRIREQECVPWYGEIQNQRSEVLGKTFNLHSNST